MTADNSPILVEPPNAADIDACVIWLHGLGADGHDFEPIVTQLSDQVQARTRFVFPNAPMRPVTINGGAVMRAWYDIYDASIDRKVDQAGVEQSAAQLRALAEEQLANGIAANKLVFAGFSQGGAIALHAGLRFAHRLAGIMALSTYLTLGERLASEGSPNNRDTPLFLAHGSQDPVVQLPLNTSSHAQLRALGYSVELHTYPMGHSVCAEELRDIDAWLERVLAG